MGALLVVLIVVLMTVALTSAWILKQVGDNYSQFVTRTAADLDHVHDIAFHSAIGYAHLLELHLRPEPEKRTELLRTIAEQRAANDKVFDEFRRDVTDPDIRSGLDEVIAQRRGARKATDAYVEACENGCPLEVEVSSSRQLLLAFEDYQGSCDKLGDLIRAKSLQSCANFTAEIRRLRLLFFGLAILPIGLALLLVALLLWLVWKTPMEVELRGANSRSNF